MQGKVGLEEHFAIDDTINDSKGFLPERVWPELRARLLDFHDKRLAEMDKHGIEIMILSLNAPAVQAIPDPKRANEIARKANDLLAEQVRKRPDRFAALAALPMQDPELAIAELERCVRDLGFCGALANGFSQVGDPNTAAYYDLKRYWPFWAAIEKLDVPFYLHPRNPLPAWSQIYEGHSWLLGPTWAFGVETATHALRLMGSGLFDAYPRLQIVLGHMGEGLPYSMWRVDNRNNWSKSPHNCPAKKKMGEYFAANFYLTTAGNFRTQTLIDAMLEIGVDRLLFSTDWPFEDISDAAVWFDAAPISEPDRLKIGRTNALRLFKLSQHAAAA
jgi:predicted TIM-barrel fold metal-dependent hydrolase